MKRLGAISVKSYMQPRREQQQWILEAAREESMLVVPEGGGKFEENLAMVMDGHTGIEHSLTITPIYRDVIELFSKSQSGYTRRCWSPTAACSARTTSTSTTTPSTIPSYGASRRGRTSTPARSAADHGAGLGLAPHGRRQGG